MLGHYFEVKAKPNIVIGYNGEWRCRSALIYREMIGRGATPYEAFNDWYAKVGDFDAAVSDLPD